MMKTIFHTVFAAAILLVGCGNPADKDATPAEDALQPVTADTIVSTPVAVSPFNKKLEWQKTGFTISSPQTATSNTVTVTPIGLAAVNDPITIDVDGVVVSADVDDLDLDRSAEILVVAKNESTTWSTAYMFSVNNGKSLGVVSIPDWKADAANLKDVNGNNEFSLVEGLLVHRMPLSENGKPNGMWRQFQCKLKNGEASKVIVVDKKMEF
jgi:uncharacterized lipoprotein NlpE involved in copper resistance